MTGATQNLGAGPRPAPMQAGCWGGHWSTQFNIAALAAPDARRAGHSRASLALAHRHKLANKETRVTHTARARGAREHGTHTRSSLQPIGYASSVPLYLCDEIHLKSSEGHRTWGRDFAYAEAARGPFPNARSACTCGGPAQRCCLLNATETEDPLLIHSMKLPFSRP